MRHRLFCAVTHLLLAALSAQRADGGDAAVAVLTDIHRLHALGCVPVVVYQRNSSEYAHLTQKVVRSVNCGSDGFLSFTSDEVLLGTTEPSSLVVKVGSNSCVLYMLLTAVAVAELTFTSLSRSDWFLGVPRYFAWLGSPSSTVDLISTRDALLRAHGLVIVLPDHNKTFNIIVPCPFCRSGDPELVHATRWSAERGFERKIDLFPEHFRNCNGHQFRTVSLDYPPFLEYVKRGIGEPVEPMDSIDIRILNTIAAAYNFTYKIYEPVDGQWGFQLPNKSWTGVIGTVERFEADFSVNVGITGQRDEAVDFTVGYHNEALTFAMSKPKPLPQWQSLVRPFQLAVWCTIGAALVVVTGVLWVIVLINNRAWVGQDQNSRSKRALGCSGLISIASLHPEGTEGAFTRAVNLTTGGFFHEDPQLAQKPSIQAFTACWLAASMVLSFSYVSTLTAFMTVPALSPTLNSLDELVRSDLSWGVQDFKAADYQLFRSSTIPLFQTIFHGLRFCPSQKDCLQRTLGESFAFVSYMTLLRNSIAVDFTDRNGDAKIALARDVFASMQLGFCVNKNSRLKFFMEKIMVRLMEGGFVQKWLTEFIDEHSKQGKAKSLAADLARVGGDRSRLGEYDGQNQPLTLYHLQGIFLVYVVCISVSIITFVIESVSC